MYFIQTFIYFIEAKRPVTVKTSAYVGAKSDQFLLAQTFLDVIGSRLNPEVEYFQLICFSNKKFCFLLACKNFSNIRT